RKARIRRSGRLGAASRAGSTPDAGHSGGPTRSAGAGVRSRAERASPTESPGATAARDGWPGCGERRFRRPLQRRSPQRSGAARNIAPRGCPLQPDPRSLAAITAERSVGAEEAGAVAVLGPQREVPGLDAAGGLLDPGLGLAGVGLHLGGLAPAEVEEQQPGAG